MKVKQLTLHNYRNYARIDLRFTHHLHIFIGENAQGKTNIIEALYLAAMGHSHRTNSDQDLIQWEKQEASVRVMFDRIDVENQIEIVLAKDRAKTISYNLHPIKPRNLIGSMNVVLFSPEDLSLVKGAPAGRRKYLDLEISQANPSYYRQLSTYNRIVSQRNMLLKKIKERRSSKDLLDGWDQQLSEIAAGVVMKRLASIKKLNMLANLMHRKISTNKESLEISYLMTGAEDAIPAGLVSWYNDKLRENREIDILRGSTSVGPHRDDIVFNVNKINLRSFGSQGQQRTGVLALKLAELEFIKSETGEYPILLLDDVMSELDANRREQLLLFIKERIQTFITATDLNYFPKKIFGKFHRVVAGHVVE